MQQGSEGQGMDMMGWTETTSFDELAKGVRTFVRSSEWGIEPVIPKFGSDATSFRMTRYGKAVAEFYNLEILRGVVDQLNGVNG